MSSPPENVAAVNLQNLVAHNPLPTSFKGDAVLFGSSLAAMTAFACLGVMVVGWMGLAMFAHRKWDKWTDPVTIYRGGWFFAGLGLTIRATAAAASLWAWDPKAAKVGATVISLQRYLDHASLICAACWLLLLALTYPAMCAQLRKWPYPVEMFARIPSLKVPIVVVLLSIGAAAAVAALRAQAGLS